MQKRQILNIKLYQNFNIGLNYGNFDEWVDFARWSCVTKCLPLQPTRRHVFSSSILSFTGCRLRCQQLNRNIFHSFFAIFKQPGMFAIPSLPDIFSLPSSSYFYIQASLPFLLSHISASLCPIAIAPRKVPHPYFRKMRRRRSCRQVWLLNETLKY